MTRLPQQTSQQQREELNKVYKQLRRLKRKLFLKAVEKPETSVDKFRHLMLRFAVENNDGSTAAESFSYSSFDSLPSIQEINESNGRICEPVC
jgi:hypothetical protein